MNIFVTTRDLGNNNGYRIWRCGLAPHSIAIFAKARDAETTAVTADSDAARHCILSTEQVGLTS
ncbi:hypothetical protein HanIR_Chr11g0523101 [Helianthus annuus]|nr:hypothetical protein HanIR_Chr11g0523101 [Helianthus annuus]